jgi:hypothetical protein
MQILLLAVYFENSLLFMHKNFSVVRPYFGESTAFLHCIFDDPWESTLKLFYQRKTISCRETELIVILSLTLKRFKVIAFSLKINMFFSWQWMRRDT